MLKKILEPIPDTRPSLALYKTKPMQVHAFPKWIKTIWQHLVDTGKDFTTIVAAVKADGLSVMFECHNGKTFRVYSRTDRRKLLLEGQDATRFVTQLACSLRARISCELRALYDGQEMGFLEVMAMLRIFRDNGMRNSGKFELQICPFGVYSVDSEGTPMTERCCSFLPHRDLDNLLREMVEPGNPVMRPVERVSYHVRLYDTAGRKQELEFLDSNHRQTVARTPQEFFDHLIREADALGIEGYVLKADPHIFEKQRVVIDKFGVRDQSAVKVKREFKVTLLACRILDEGKGKGRKSLIFTYARNRQGDLVYAGDQTGHERLNMLLRADMHAYSFKTKEEKADLYTLSKERYQQRASFFVMTTSSCTNMSKDRFCPIGLKLHDMSSKTVDLDKLSVLQDVAEGNPHFRSTKEACNRFAAAIGRDEKKRPAPTQEAKRPRTAQAAASLGWEDFMAEIGEEFQPPPPVERQPSPEIVLVEEVPAPVVKETEPEIPHVVLFSDPPGPMQAKLYKAQLAELGWTLASTTGPSVTLIVAANEKAIERMHGTSKDLKEKCPNAGFITHAALKARLSDVRV